MTPQRIGLISSAVPLTFGGGRFIVDWLEEKLRDRGHSVETIYIPTTEDPDSIIEQMAAFRMMDLDPHFDRSHHVPAAQPSGETSAEGLLVHPPYPRLL